MGRLTDPRSLKPSLGREGWCQRLLTELILDGPYPPYNSHLRPSPHGVAFLGALDQLSFGKDAVSTGNPVFVDEIDLAARHPDEQGCAPDYTVFLDGRCWIIELKTEPGSHRPRQIPDYFERAHHYHPESRVDITYLTAGLRKPFQPATEQWERYAHIEWTQVADLILSVWSGATDEHTLEVMNLLITGIAHLSDAPPEWWSRLGYELDPVVVVGATEAAAVVSSASHLTERLPSAAIEEGLALARATANDGRQRALGLEVGGLEALDELRLELRRACRAERSDFSLASVQPWLWNARTSGGAPMTPAGLRSGYEVRVSRARSVT